MASGCQWRGSAGGAGARRTQCHSGSPGGAAAFTGKLAMAQPGARLRAALSRCALNDSLTRVHRDSGRIFIAHVDDTAEC